MSVSLGAASLVLFIDWVATSQLELAEALKTLIEALSSGVIIVGALEWFERQRWRQAEAMTLQSLAFTVALVASGWSAPRNITPPDLHAKSLCQELRKAAIELEEHAKKFGDFYELPKDSQSDIGSALIGYRLLSVGWAIEKYEFEGGRGRRFDYIGTLVDTDITALLQRRSDPQLAAYAAQLRRQATSAFAARAHFEAVVDERLMLQPPPVVAKAFANAFVDRVDSLLLLRRAAQVIGDLMKEARNHSGSKGDFPGHLNRCFGALRNELERVSEVMESTAQLVEYLADDIDRAAEMEARLGG
jgi:hypothetical protein